MTSSSQTNSWPRDFSEVVLADSEALGWQYGMALVNDGFAVDGQQINLFQELGQGRLRYTATVVPPHFYDPEGERLRM